MSNSPESQEIQPSPSGCTPPPRDLAGKGSRKLPCLSQRALNRRSMGEVLRNGAIIGAVLGTLCSMPLTSFTPENSGRSTLRLLPMFVFNGLICAGMGAAVVAILLAVSWTVLASLIDLADGIAQSAKSLWSSQDIEQATSAGSQLPKADDANSAAIQEHPPGD